MGPNNLSSLKYCLLGESRYNVTRQNLEQKNTFPPKGPIDCSHQRCYFALQKSLPQKFKTHKPLLECINKYCHIHIHVKLFFGSDMA